MVERSLLKGVKECKLWLECSLLPISLIKNFNSNTLTTTNQKWTSTKEIELKYPYNNQSKMDIYKRNRILNTKMICSRIKSYFFSYSKLKNTTGYFPYFYPWFRFIILILFIFLSSSFCCIRSWGSYWKTFNL